MYSNHYQPNHTPPVNQIGDYSQRATDMRNYLIVFKHDLPETSAQLGRAALVKANTERTQTLIAELQIWLQEQSIDQSKAIVGEPTSFSMVSLTAMPDVAKEIAALPKVDSVILD